MSVRKEMKQPDRIAAHILKRAGGMQGTLLDPTTTYVPENQARHEEVWGRDVADLFHTDNRLRYHRFTGELYIKSYRNVSGQSRVRWGKSADVESGIRQADHVQEAYDQNTGREIEKTKQAISIVRDLSIDFHRPGLLPLEVQSMAEAAALKLAEAGFVDAKKDAKQEVVDKIVKAANLDSLKRVNPGRSRLILSHAWVDLIHELLVGKMIENKYSRMGAKLIREREFERFVLSQTVAHIDDLTQSSTSFEDQRSVQELKLFTRDYLSSDVVRLKPYARLAAISRFLVMNTGTKKELDLLRKYIGDDAELYYGTKPFTRLDRDERIGRLKGVKATVEEGLEIGELFLHTATAERPSALQQYYAQKPQKVPENSQ